MKRAVIVGALLLVLAGVAGTGWAILGDREEEDGRLVLQGNVDVRQVELAFEVGGRIAAMAVEEGDTVAAGQVVASLDTGYFDDEVRRARAEVEALRANLAELERGARPEEIAQARARVAERRTIVKNARATLKRQEALVQRGVASQQVYDDALAALNEAEAQLASAEAALALTEAGPRQEEIAAARARLDAARASLALAERRLADAVLRAPSAGIVLTRVREPGAFVAPGETVYALTLPTPVWVRTYVAEPDLGRVRPGMPATVTTDAGRVYRGHVGFISPVAEFTPKSVETTELRTDLVYRLRVIADNPDAGLRQGMPVTVTLDPGPEA